MMKGYTKKYFYKCEFTAYCIKIKKNCKGGVWWPRGAIVKFENKN